MKTRSIYNYIVILSLKSINILLHSLFSQKYLYTFQLTSHNSKSGLRNNTFYKNIQKPYLKNNTYKLCNYLNLTHLPFSRIHTFKTPTNEVKWNIRDRYNTFLNQLDHLIFSIDFCAISPKDALVIMWAAMCIIWATGCLQQIHEITKLFRHSYFIQVWTFWLASHLSYNTFTYL